MGKALPASHVVANRPDKKFRLSRILISYQRAAVRSSGLRDAFDAALWVAIRLGSTGAAFGAASMTTWDQTYPDADRSRLGISNFLELGITS